MLFFPSLDTLIELVLSMRESVYTTVKCGIGYVEVLASSLPSPALLHTTGDFLSILNYSKIIWYPFLEVRHSFLDNLSFLIIFAKQENCESIFLFIFNTSIVNPNLLSQLSYKTPSFAEIRTYIELFTIVKIILK